MSAMSGRFRESSSCSCRIPWLASALATGSACGDCSGGIIRECLKTLLSAKSLSGPVAQESRPPLAIQEVVLLEHALLSFFFLFWLVPSIFVYISISLSALLPLFPSTSPPPSLSLSLPCLCLFFLSQKVRRGAHAPPHPGPKTIPVQALRPEVLMETCLLFRRFRVNYGRVCLSPLYLCIRGSDKQVSLSLSVSLYLSFFSAFFLSFFLSFSPPPVSLVPSAPSAHVRSPWALARQTCHRLPGTNAPGQSTVPAT